jgi:chaperonin GroES
MNRTYQPYGDRVLIKPADREAVSAGGILLPDTVQEKPQEGKVVAVGPGRTADDGKRIAMESKVGDLVVYSKLKKRARIICFLGKMISLQRYLNHSLLKLRRKE